MASYHAGGGAPEAAERGLTSGTALVKFSAKWCGPCRAVHPQFLALAAQSPFPFYHIDIEDDPAGVTTAFEVASLPTFVLLRDGAELGRVEGAYMDRVRALLERAPEQPPEQPPDAESKCEPTSILADGGATAGLF